MWSVSSGTETRVLRSQDQYFFRKLDSKEGVLKRKTEKVTIPSYVLKMSIFNFANHNLLIAKYSALV